MAESPQRGLVMADLEGNDSPTGVNEYGFSPPRVEAAPEISPISAQGSPEFQFSPGSRRSTESPRSRRSNGRQGITESQESLLAPTNLGNDIDVESEPMIKRSRYEGGKRKSKKSKKTKKSKKSKKSKKVRRG
jgi:hypothetical protein